MRSSILRFVPRMKATPIARSSEFALEPIHRPDDSLVLGYCWETIDPYEQMTPAAELNFGSLTATTAGAVRSVTTSARAARFVQLMAQFLPLRTIPVVTSHRVPKAAV